MDGRKMEFGIIAEKLTMTGWSNSPHFSAINLSVI
jgi:hypothetical protein